MDTLQYGSRECTPCGSGTTSKKTRDGCDYNDCTFKAAPGVLYNLSPLKVVNGSMHKAKTYDTKSHRYYPKLYFINVCSHDHDNNSCMVYRRDRNNNDIEVTITIKNVNSIELFWSLNSKETELCT